PSAGCLAAAGEVVLQPLRHLLLVVCELVVRRAQLSDGQHGGRRRVGASPMHVVCPRSGGWESGPRRGATGASGFGRGPLVAARTSDKDPENPVKQRRPRGWVEKAKSPAYGEIAGPR